MFRNYLLTAARYLFKRKAYTIVNVLGLSAGLACFTLISLWVKEELSYDRFHAKADRTYRIAGIFKDGSGTFDQAVTPPPLGPAVTAMFPEVEATIRLDKSDAMVHLGEKQFLEDRIILADQAFLSSFDFPLLEGNRDKALSEAYQVVLTESMAKKYFGRTDIVGESLKIFIYDPDGNGKEFQVTGVIADCPANSHFQYNFLVSFKTMEVTAPQSLSGDGWYWNGYYTYVVLREGTDAKAFEAKLPGLIETHMGVRNREWKISYSYFLQPLTSIHLHSNVRYEIEPTTSMTYVTIFGAIGLLVLLLACINYVNLATSFTADRFNDVGVRKAMGAFRSQLMGQYLAESWLMAMFSLFAGFLWVEASRPLFESLTGRPLNGLYDPANLLLLASIASAVGLLAGMYPALLLSKFKASKLLRGGEGGNLSSLWLRKGLVALQYSITVVLVIGILVVQGQFRFIQSRDLGYDHHAMLVLGVNGSPEVRSGYSAFRQELLDMRLAEHVARSSSSITGGLGNSVAEMLDAAGNKVNSTCYRLRVDYDYLDTYRMTLVAGRFLSMDFRSDSTRGYIVNESLVRNYGYTDPADAIGKAFNFGGNDGEIVGVVRDFHYNSLQYKVEPTCMFLLRDGFSRIAVRLNGNPAEAQNKIAALWKKHFPNSVFDARFVDDALASQYGAERRFSKVFVTFSVVSLIIACAGLFALVSFSVERRSKEIGIRKVLGASAGQILGMVSREFLVLLAAASVVAAPIGLYLMQGWLNSFAYRMDLPFSIGILAVVILLAIALVTICLRSLSAANANPVDSLRSE